MTVVHALYSLQRYKVERGRQPRPQGLTAHRTIPIPPPDDDGFLSRRAPSSTPPPSLYIAPKSLKGSTMTSFLLLLFQSILFAPVLADLTDAQVAAVKQRLAEGAQRRYLPCPYLQTFQSHPVLQLGTWHKSPGASGT